MYTIDPNLDLTHDSLGKKNKENTRRMTGTKRENEL